MPPQKGLLRFLTCGSVDDGKSTLIGRLLYDCGQVPQDQLASLAVESRKRGATEGEMDFALLVDGLLAEREQNITIDVAYRYFSTARRTFIVADSPGHEQYTRNMATGASVSDVAVVLVDARKGVLEQTRRHTAILGLFGIKDVALAVNKMDLVHWDEKTYRTIADDYAALAQKFGIERVVAIPVVAASGDNLGVRGKPGVWYQGPTLLDHLETIEPARPTDLAFHMPIQWVNRQTGEYRGYCGTIGGGTIATGDPVKLLPSGQRTRVKRIHGAGGVSISCTAGDAVTIELADAFDLARGDMLAAPDFEPDFADRFEADILWLDEIAMMPGRGYLLKCGTQSVTASVGALASKLDIETREGKASDRQLALNEIGRGSIMTSQPLLIRPFAKNPAMGSFILVDKISNATIGAGLITETPRRATNIVRQPLAVNRSVRAALKAQKPRCVWFTGLSGAGKSTIANVLEKQLAERGRHTYILDGDNVRHGLNRDLGFSDADRVENVRRVAEVAKLMVDAGLIVIVSFISPFREERLMARELFDEGEFIEVFVDTPLDICEARDAKGLYRKARSGEIAHFTGISSPYEPPSAPELRLDGGASTPETLAGKILARLEGP